MKYVENGTHLERKGREAFEFLDHSHDPHDLFRFGATRLNFCNAKIFTASNGLTYLQSYDTIVAVLIRTAHSHTCVANGTYCRTSVQHIYKFARKFGAQVEYLKPQLKVV